MKQFHVAAVLVEPARLAQIQDRRNQRAAHREDLHLLSIPVIEILRCRREIDAVSWYG